MRVSIAREYYRLRKIGFDASAALRAARVKVAFDDRCDVVRLRLEPDNSPDLSYLDQDIFADSRDSEYERANRDGVWGVIGEYLNPHTGTWEHADSCWGFIGEDWKDSGYDTDIRRATLDAIDQIETQFIGV